MGDEGESQTQLEFRYGHSEGITGIDCTGEEGTERLVTCGADSDLRLWKGFHDEDPTAYELADNGLTLVCGKTGVIYVGTEFNTVEAIRLEDGKNLGVKAKFTGPVNHVDLSTDGKWLVAGSGDMKIKLIHLEDSSIQPVTIDTHSAPVLSVALDPLKEFLASSGCDGNVCVWRLTDEGKAVNMVKKLESVFPSSNDITTSSTLCRIAWEGNGKILAVPEEDHIALYARDSWAKLKVLRPQKSKKIASVTKFSQCGNYLAAGGSDGSLIVWRVSDSKILSEGALFSDQITGIIFANKGSDIIAADNRGKVLLLKDFKTQAVPKPGPDSKQPESSKSNEDAVDKDSDDDVEALSPTDNSEPKDPDGDEFDDGMDDLFADDGENEFSISKIKAETGFVGDEYVGVDKAKVIIGGDLSNKHKNKSDDDEDDAVSVSSTGSIPQSRKVVRPQVKIVNPVTEPQKPFQPSSTPVHLNHRFMLWNNTGIIRTYSLEDEEKDAIDIEFHDAAVHPAIHMKNNNDYFIAALTKEMAVFANEKQYDADADAYTGSMLYCRYFGSWDSKKEWTMELQAGEGIVGLAAGDSWIAASTDVNRIRIFTSGGVQKQLIEVGGQIIATSGHEDLLFVTFHNGVGINGNQSVAYSIFRLKPDLKPVPVVPYEPLPITPKSQVSWIGFSDEGTPVYSDSQCILRIMSGRCWTTFCALKEQSCTDSTDHFWVVGVSELDQKIRGVKCKGMRYPQTLPRPQLMQVTAQIPLCEMHTEKSQLEDKFLLSLMLDGLSKKMDKKNYEVDDYKSKANRDRKDSLMKLFSISCKGNWEARGAEYISMMPDAHAVHVAVKLASQLRKRALVDRISAIGRRKLFEEDVENEFNVSNDDDFESVKMGTVNNFHMQNRSLAADYSASQDLFPEASSSRFNTSSASLSNSFSTGNRSVVTVPEEENPFMKKNTEDIRKILGSSSDSASNKFRKEKPANASNEGGECARGLSVIDSWRKPTAKPVDLFTKTVTRNSKVGGKKGSSEKDKTKEPAPNKEKKGKNTNPTDAPKDNKKRKISEVEECSPTNASSEGEKKSKLTSKLSAFACSNAD